MNNIAYVTVKVEVLPDADVQEIVSVCDYNFYHPEIVKTEIVDVFDDESVDIIEA